MIVLDDFQPVVLDDFQPVVDDDFDPVTIDDFEPVKKGNSFFEKAFDTVKSLPSSALPFGIGPAKYIAEELYKRKDFSTYEQSLPNEADLPEFGDYTQTKEYFRALEAPEKISHMATGPLMTGMLAYGIPQAIKSLPYTQARAAALEAQIYKTQKVTPAQLGALRDYFNGIKGSELPKEFKGASTFELKRMLKQGVRDVSLARRTVRIVPEGDIKLIKGKVDANFQPKPMSKPKIPAPVPKNEEISKALGELRSLKTRALSALDVEFPFREVGAPKTGLAIKTMVSKQAAGQEKALMAIKELNNFGLSDEEYREVALLSGDIDPQLTNLPENKAKAVKNVTKLFESSFEELKERGALDKPFPASAIDRMRDEINTFKSQQDSLALNARTNKEKRALNNAKRYDALITDTEKQLEKAEPEYLRQRSIIETKQKSLLKLLEKQTEKDLEKIEKLPKEERFKERSNAIIKFVDNYTKEKATLEGLLDRSQKNFVNEVSRALGKPTLTSAKDNIRFVGSHERDKSNILKKLENLRNKFNADSYLILKEPTFDEAKIKLSTERRKNLIQARFNKTLDALDKNFAVKETRMHKKMLRIKKRRNALLENNKVDPFKIAEYQELQNKISESESSINALEQVKYVHIPSRLWFEAEGKFNPGGLRKALANFSQIKGRETISIRDLIDKKVLPMEKVDIRDIVANYIVYKESQLAELDIIDASKKEGLARKISEAPAEWSEIPTRYAPALKGYKVHPAFADYLENYFRNIYSPGSEIGKGMALLKLSWFTNPIVMPMYDLFQSAMAQTLLTPRLLPNMKRAIQAVFSKNADYFEMYDGGTFSVPFKNPFNLFMDQIEGMKGQVNNGTLLVRSLKNLAPNILPQNWIKALYTASFNMAWTGDKIIRAFTYFGLKDKGFSAEDAAQVAALFHGDYASVPAATRKALNKIFFTPTFQIVMEKLYQKMLTDAVVSTGKIAIGQTPTQKEKTFGKGLLVVAGISYGKDLLMKSLQFQRQEFCRKYYRIEDTDEGEKEIVMTFANPANMVQRYWYKFANPMVDPLETNKAQKTMGALKMMLHPLYQIGIEIAMNQDERFEPIVNKFDDPKTQTVDYFKYLTRRMVKITEILLKDETEGDKQLKQAVNRSNIKFFYNIMDPITFKYIRNTKAQRNKWKIKNLRKEYKRLLITDPPKDTAELVKRRKTLDKITRELKEGL